MKFEDELQVFTILRKQHMPEPRQYAANIPLRRCYIIAFGNMTLTTLRDAETATFVESKKRVALECGQNDYQIA